MRFYELTSDEKMREMIDFVRVEKLVKTDRTCLSSFLILGP